MMQFDIEFEGDVVERGELLNGTQMVTLAGTSVDGAWTLDGSLSWNMGLVESSGEGDITLVRGADELFGTLTTCAAGDAGPEGGADETVDAEYEIDGGAGAFEGASGAGTARIVIAGPRFSGRWRVELT